ncbi:MAG: hypothetical protein ACQET5_09460 [Halobacteriota archaeon]
MTERPERSDEQATDAGSKTDGIHLTRRDALAVLGTLAGGTTAGLAAADGDQTSDPGMDGETVATDRRVATATAVAEVVYPSTVDVDREFVETYLFGRTEPQAGHFDGVAKAIDAVDRLSRARYGVPMRSSSPADRRRVLDGLGVRAVHSRPEGTTAEQVRHYLVNDLLYALFTHPKGGDLIGVSNPPGHFGGRSAYQGGDE